MPPLLPPPPDGLPLVPPTSASVGPVATGPAAAGPVVTGLVGTDSVILNGQGISLGELAAVARHAAPVALGASARQAMERSREWVVSVLHSEQPIYGVNTGFGSLARVRIRPSDSSTLSRNLIRSHAAGVGIPCPTDIVRATLLLRANALSQGASGCRVILVETLLAMLRAGVHPVVPRQGSCGSSGDLAPLSHIGLVVFGEGGSVELDGEILDGVLAMARTGIPTLSPAAKEGLAMTNGAQLTTAIAALGVVDALALLDLAEVAAAMSIEALRGVTRAFHPAVHRLRPHPGAMESAAHLRALLAGSTLVDSIPEKVQDAYSLRCTPVVLGACRDTLNFGRRVVEVEINAVTDNPVILVDEPGYDHAFSAGLFHGEPVGIAADTMKIAVAEIASLSERRLYRLTTGTLSGRLPPALLGADRPSLGWLVPQTAAAALVSENKALAWPSSVDSIPTCEDQEDHVAMSTTAAWRFRDVLENSRKVVAIELIAAAAALRWRLGDDPTARLGAGARRTLPQIEALVAGKDVPSEQIAAVEAAIVRGELSAVGLFDGPSSDGLSSDSSSSNSTTRAESAG